MTDLSAFSHIGSSWSGICEADDCRFALPPLREIADEFFTKGSAACRQCGCPVDVWNSACRHARDDHSKGYVSLPGLGARLSPFIFELKSGETKELDFSSVGVPGDAIVLSVNYTSQGPGCFANELHGNESRHRMKGTRVKVFGVPAQGKKAPGPTRIACSVCWIHEADDSEPWLLLADALEASAARHYSKVLVPAHSLVEISVSRLIASMLSQHSSKEAVDRFIENNLTSSSARNVLLPYVCAQASIPPLPDAIRGKLNRLATLRNHVVHRGLADPDLDKSEVGELLCAAIFGFEYVRFARSRLSQP